MTNIRDVEIVQGADTTETIVWTGGAFGDGDITITAVITSTTTGVTVASDGTFAATVASTANGTFTYTPGSTDKALAAGLYTIQYTATENAIETISDPWCKLSVLKRDAV